MALLGVVAVLLDVGAGLLAALAGEDRVDQVVLAQAAEVLDPELAGEQVEVGERALLEPGAVKHGGHVVPFLRMSVGGHRAALCAAAGNRSPLRLAAPDTGPA